MLEASENLSRNIKRLRDMSKLTQTQLAKQASVPRTSISHMESGQSNPSLNNLFAVAKALRVTVDELLSPPYNPVQYIPKSKVPRVEQAAGNVEISKIVPEPIQGFEIDRVLVQPGYRMKGSPHMKGTKEYLCSIKGGIHLYTEGEVFKLKAGDVVVFPGDQAHSYYNSGKSQAEFVSVVIRSV
mgnify:CR=1 FL=1